MMSLTFAATGELAAQISWQTPVNLFQGDATDETFVSLNGDGLVAYNATNLLGNGAIGMDTTVNGVLFTATETTNTLVGANSVSITIDQGGNNEGAFGGGQFGPNAAVVELIEGGSFNIQTVTLAGLTIGDTYEIQVIIQDGRGSRANAVTAFSDGVDNTVAASSPANLNNSNTGDPDAGNTGDFIIGTFTATAETLTFQVFGDGNSTDGINFGTGGSPSAIVAMQLRDVTALVVDSDGDGMDDLYETAQGLDPAVDDAALDLDEDGISNFDEFSASPQLPAGNPDADNDGLNDGEEVDGLVNTFGTPVASGDQLTSGVSVGAATDPLVADSDGDSFFDGDEVNGVPNSAFSNEATDPNSDDSDGDELPDVFELTFGLDPNDDGSTDPANGLNGNPDGDGLDNFLENEEGTDPTNADTDNDGLNDGGPIVDGIPTGELVTEIIGGFPEVVDELSDPLIPDADFDRLLDGEELLAGTDGFITDPTNVDTDGDGTPDAYEGLEGTDPSADTGAAVSPAYATIDWSVVAVDNVDADGVLVAGVGAAAVRNDGTLLYAINMSGGDATVNGVDFVSGLNDTTPRGTADFLTLITNNSNQNAFYQGPDTELPALLDSVWFSPGNRPIPQMLLTGLTVGEDYFVQFGVSDNRANRPGRFATVDGSFGGEAVADPIGSTNTIYGGDTNSGLVFTGTFTAALETQQFTLRSFVPGGGDNEIFINFLQLRLDDGTLPPTPTEVTIVDCGVADNGDFFIELANSATGATVLESADLATPFAAIDAGSVTITGNVITIDAAAADPNGDGRSFFRVSFLPAS